MTREWKPGDVAMVDTCCGEAVAMRGPDNDWRGPGGTHTDGGGVKSVRPLVLIDPANRKQIERFTSVWLRHEPGVNIADLDKGIDRLQAALREFAKPIPPKPDEPLGIGAVVEDSEGERWVRRCANADDAAYLEKPWLCGAVNKNWQIVAAVKVLSEGVQP